MASRRRREMPDDEGTNERQEAADASSVPSLDETTGQPIEEAEDNLSRFSTKDSRPPVEEQGRTTEKGDADQPLGGSALREKNKGRE
jgi:hypothetical protein